MLNLFACIIKQLLPIQWYFTQVDFKVQKLVLIMWHVNKNGNFFLFSDLKEISLSYLNIIVECH